MIINKTKQQVLSKTHKDCKSTWSKARGLMFSKQKTLVFYFKKPQIVSLHMAFVFFAIDVLFIDENSTIVEIKRNFTPYSYYKPKKKAKIVIEIPAFNLKDTEVDDEIEIK